LNFDVVVVGGSSAGLYAAELLAQQGKRVAVFEREKGISTSSRLYIITPGLYRVIPDLDPRLIRQQVQAFQLFAGDCQVRINLSEPDLVIDRIQLLRYLYDRAVSAGVEFYFNCEFISFNDGADGNSILFENIGKELRVKTDCLIGADGVQSKIRTALGMNSIPQVPLLQAEVKLPSDWDDMVSQVWFKPSRSKYFFWMIPDDDRRGVAGLIAEPGSDIRRLLSDFLEEIGLTALGFQSGSAAMYSPSQPMEAHLGNLRVLLIGDAGGQVKVTTVGGSVTGLAGSRAAVQAIAENVAYHHPARGLKRELQLHWLIRELLDQMRDKDYQVLVDKLNPNVRAFLEKNDRDAMRRHFWKLVFYQPAFIPLGLKMLARRLISVER
jgi:flavin-dependent dehydrogenase